MGALRFLTAGESHGQALAATLEGIPAGLSLTAEQIATDLARRQLGYGRGARQAIEKDRAEILAGVRHGLTIGSPILLLVRNRDWENWTRVMQVEPLSDEDAAELLALAEGGNARAMPVTRVRPGHADLAGALKYGFGDVRNVLERASARETTARVAAGAVARAFLAEFGIDVAGLAVGLLSAPAGPGDVRLLGVRVGGEHRGGGGDARVRRGGELGRGLLDAGDSSGPRQLLADDAGGAHGDLDRAAGEHLGGLLRGGVRGLEALGTGAGVGAAGVEDDRAQPHRR